MRIFFYILLFLPYTVFSQTYELGSLTTETNTSIRGLSVVSDSVAWVSGSNGFIGKTTNGGKAWKWVKPKGYEKLDFRDIEAFDENNAVIVNAGSPAYILRTNDGGKNWTETYKNLDSAIFLDGMDFWSEKKGIIFGDPVKNHMQLLITEDGGLSWKDASANLGMDMAPGEAAFAASGTSIRTMPGGRVWFATGGARSNIYTSDNYGVNWKKYNCPILQGSNSSGAFSLDFYDANKGIVVGGDYQKDKENTNNVLLTFDGGKSWEKPFRPVFGFRSGVIWFDEKNCFVTGTSGTDVSKNGGQNWYHISDDSFNVIKKAKKGTLVLLAGNKGLIYSLKVK
ncbi:YCF48-related protein [Pedobacter sp. L105]|uniref:WD40/YVTN/BNR-like repeat-containing protein n=1 Tax=Pedobacter sp. L105 TaxID=1641871 RepID=UPI00131AFCAE|nr:YCF48-related protein [Pedobacter sp. L105]